MPKARLTLIEFVQLAPLAVFLFIVTMAQVVGQTDESVAGARLPDVPSSQMSTSNSKSTDQLPSLPQPPPLNDRPPIPAPPAIALPDLPASPIPKPNLSWRVKAYALANELPSAASGDRFAWSLPVSFDKGRQLLASALSQTGFQLLASYSDAGQYLAKLSGEEGDTQIIIVVKPLNDSLTSYQLRILANGHHCDRRRIENLPKVMNMILGNRGLL